MDDDLSFREVDAEIRRTCSVLESIANKFDPASLEHQALRDAATAFILVRQRKSLKSAFQKLKAAVNGAISEETNEKLRSIGIDPEELDSADDP